MYDQNSPILVRCQAPVNPACDSRTLRLNFVRVPSTLSLLLLLIGLSIGAAITWSIMRAIAQRDIADMRLAVGADLGASEARAEEQSRRALDLQARLTARETTVATLQHEISGLHHDRARLQAELEGERRSAAEKLSLLDNARQTLKDAFGAASADALKANNEAFLQLARTSLEKTQERAAADLTSKHTEIASLVQPIRDSLAKITDHVHQVDRERIASAQALTTQLQAVGETQERLRRETEGLVRALKSPNQRGRWGRFSFATSSSAPG